VYQYGQALTLSELYTYYYFFFEVLGFELRVLHLLGKNSTTWATPVALFSLVYFSDRISRFVLRARFRLWSSHLHLLYNQDYRHVSQCPTVIFDKVFKVQYEAMHLFAQGESSLAKAFYLFWILFPASTSLQRSRVTV
jgi:hypothetical protein